MGKRQLEEAIKRLFLQTEIKYLPFELNPLSTNPGVNRKKYLEERYGPSIKPMDEKLSSLGKELGIDFQFDLIERIPNTFNAHRLIWLAQKKHVQARVLDILQKGYFTYGKDIGSLQTLVDLAREADMDPQEVKSFLESDLGSQSVRDLEQEANRLGVTGVPFFIFDHETAVSGAQGIDVFESILSDLSA